MTALGQQHVPLGRDPDEELRHLQSSFRAISKRHGRTIKRRRLYRRANLSMLAAIGVGLLYLGLMSLSPWPAMVTLKHIAAFPNCAAARAVGLAPANKGEPGYWRRHDRDHDGTACEPWAYP